MFDFNRSPYGWSKRIAAVRTRDARSEAMALVNAERHAIIRKGELAREVRAGDIDQESHDEQVSEIDARLKAMRGHQLGQSAPPQSASPESAPLTSSPEPTPAPPPNPEPPLVPTPGPPAPAKTAKSPKKSKADGQGQPPLANAESPADPPPQTATDSDGMIVED